MKLYQYLHTHSFWMPKCSLNKDTWNCTFFIISSTVLSKHIVLWLTTVFLFFVNSVGRVAESPKERRLKRESSSFLFAWKSLTKSLNDLVRNMVFVQLKLIQPFLWLILVVTFSHCGSQQVRFSVQEFC